VGQGGELLPGQAGVALGSREPLGVDDLPEVGFQDHGMLFDAKIQDCLIASNNLVGMATACPMTHIALCPRSMVRVPYRPGTTHGHPACPRKDPWAVASIRFGERP